MIIVSQNKETIINFESITRISIIPPLEMGYKYSIAINGCLDLGYYKTKEIAKEVLQEIIKSYRDYRTAECDGYTNVLQETAVFEMPED